MTTTAAVTAERDYWVALCLAAGIGPVRFQHLLQFTGSPRAAWAAPDFDLVRAGLERRSIDSLNRLRRTTSPEAIARDLARQQHRHAGVDRRRTTRPACARSPIRRRYCSSGGSILEADDYAVAIVGTRRASPYGHAVAERLAADLAAAGVTVVSGLAKGIDTSAHQATLDAGGRTLAVLGNGLDQVYPPANTRLATRIADAGALISEFPPGTPPDAVNFPRRNRIIAGLARATLIVEAPAHSGALITADFALEHGRDVMAVPGSIFSPMSVGTNELLKQGAMPVTGVDDILAVLGGGARHRRWHRPCPISSRRKTPCGRRSGVIRATWMSLPARWASRRAASPRFWPCWN